MTLIDLVLKGGPINGILFVAYLICLGIIIERSFYFLWTYANGRKFQRILLSLEDVALRPFRRSSFYALSAVYLRHLDCTESELRLHISVESSGILARLDSSLWILNMLGSLAPMLGLLGTMTGLIKSFHGIESMGGHVDVALLSGGIWEAMLTTVGGMVVGLLSLCAFRILDHYVEKRTQQMNTLLHTLSLTFDKKGVS
jgi:biopolymer transport protein ExbB